MVDRYRSKSQSQERHYSLLDFHPTGVPVIDDIRRAVDNAARSYHEVDYWHDEDPDGRTCVQDIQDAIDTAAREYRKLSNDTTRRVTDAEPAANEDAGFGPTAGEGVVATTRDRWDDMLDRHRVLGPSAEWTRDEWARNAAYSDMVFLVGYVRRLEVAVDSWREEAITAREREYVRVPASRPILRVGHVE